MTELTMSSDVQARLSKRLGEHSQLILDFDDGVGAYSKVGVCSLDVSFRLLIVDESQAVDPVYDDKLTSPLGDVLIKGYAANFVDEHPRLEANKFGLISLVTDTGVVDTNVEILDNVVLAN
ncbi:hypothetical protein FD04_GL001428 [Secundilactobacillus odoratitofui DSM 19909 = JCM 15043]|uniref:Core domain-containing protein n=1 Tax=Secundilactobacillus odoratitofui DSM 19909 = JCM 15043 TaxID=1423776 RepID=A0A0R1LNE3_9LACO|nr:iron-sulfur cluster biosynthesis family protein [Secundilactobacillus odoratitofui]KRK97406.1 hypothetical protein FD04_GL001428 [Secundilactobacillus odoratitofui DSM 19909 = JCM 15043]